jgi:hypothetical protein
VFKKALEMGVSLHRDHVGKPRGGPFIGNFERELKEGSGNGSSLSAGALLGEPGGRVPLLGIRKDMWRRTPGIGISLLGGPRWGAWKGAYLPGTLGDRWRALKMEGLSLWELDEGNLERGGAPLLGTLKVT